MGANSLVCCISGENAFPLSWVTLVLYLSLQDAQFAPPMLSSWSSSNHEESLH